MPFLQEFGLVLFFVLGHQVCRMDVVWLRKLNASCSEHEVSVLLCCRRSVPREYVTTKMMTIVRFTLRAVLGTNMFIPHR